MKKTLCIVSGGMDSVTLAYLAKQEGHLGYMLSFDYGQRHKKELHYAAKAAAALGVPHSIIDLTPITPHLKGSSLTDSANVAVPDGHYTQDSMKQTIVPNRNAIMLAIAYGVAAGEGCNQVGTAVHSGDHYIYPDCRPAFIKKFADMQNAALGDMWQISLWTPFVSISKAGITAQGVSLDVPYADTWSCYKGGEIHCGRCGTCVERQEAFALAPAPDPTVYEDPEYWINTCLSKGSLTAAQAQLARQARKTNSVLSK